MILEEFSNQFDVLVNSYRRFKDFDDRELLDSVEFDEYEKSLYLTKAQEELVLSLYNGRNSSLQGFEETEAVLPLDLLKRAGIEVTTVGVGGREITGSHGIKITADITDSIYDGSDMTGIILPGGMPGTRNLEESHVLDEALKDAFDGEKLLCAICAAPSVLGKKGMLFGKRAVCFPGFEQYLSGAKLSDRRVVRDGRVITAVGMGAALEFGLEIVAAVNGKKAAEALAAAIIAPDLPANV